MTAKLAELTAATSALSREEKLALADYLLGEAGPENPAAYEARGTLRSSAAAKRCFPVK
jgi:hypothetical protein